MLDYETGSSPGHPESFSGAKLRLMERVECSLSGPVSDEERISRLSVRVEGISPLGWLRSRETGPKSYWSGRGERREVATVGAADRRAGESTIEEVSSLLGRGDPGARYYGGMRFDHGRAAGEEWASFGPLGFVLPRFELVAEAGACSLVCNLVLPRDVGKKEEILVGIERLAAPGRGIDGMAARPPGLIKRTDAPDFDGWRKNVERALEAFEAGDLGKVVLARRAGLVFERDLDALSVFESLKAATPGCFHFFFEMEDGAAFLGASPERLYRRDGRAIRSEAVAGTRPRGESAPDDEDLRDELLGSEKDRSEHRYVRESIGEDLRPLCEALGIEEGVSEMKLASRRHLVSKVRGTLDEGTTDADVLRALHPTPAVGGYPKEEAKTEIRAVEPFDRGWYAGPVGWISSSGAEFAVGIRSGLARGNELALFSGAGIVPGSTPEGEWAEIEQKIADFASVLGLDDSLEYSREHAAH